MRLDEQDNVGTVLVLHFEGPFWVCATLVFTTAITGNLASYLSNLGNHEWVYDFHKGRFNLPSAEGDHTSNICHQICKSLIDLHKYITQHNSGEIISLALSSWGTLPWQSNKRIQYSMSHFKINYFYLLLLVKWAFFVCKSVTFYSSWKLSKVQILLLYTTSKNNFHWNCWNCSKLLGITPKRRINGAAVICLIFLSYCTLSPFKVLYISVASPQLQTGSTCLSIVSIAKCHPHIKNW